MLCAMKENLKVDNSRLGASFLNRLYHTESHFISLIIPLKMLRKGTKRLYLQSFLKAFKFMDA